MQIIQIFTQMILFVSITLNIPLIVDISRGGGIEHPCNHEHTESCYYSVTKCIHEHTADCYSDGILPGPEEEKEADACIHQCSVESGCVEKILNCLHEHDEFCGYSEAVEGHPCEYVCEICDNADNNEEVSCICETACSEDQINNNCAVCSEDILKCALYSGIKPMANGTIETYDELISVIENASQKTVLTISGNIEIEETLTIRNGMSIEFNGDGVLYPSKSLAEQTESPLIKIESGGELTIDGITISGNYLGPDQEGTEYRSGRLIDCEGTFILRSGRIRDAFLETDHNTGIITVYGESALFEMYGGYIEDNVIDCMSRCGSVVIRNAAKFNMYGGYIQNNICTQVGYALEPATGGVILLSDVSGTPENSTAEFNMYDGYILNNKASGSSYSAGGGVCLWGADFQDSWSRYNAMKMEGGVISGNETVYGGGGIFVYGFSSLKMTGGEISENIASNGIGGGICAYDGLKDYLSDDATIKTYSELYNLGEFILNGGTITGNTANRSVIKGDNGCGGGIYIATMNSELIKGVISNNVAHRQGGGIYIGSTPYVVHMENSVIKDNYASILGGGLWFCPTGDVRSVVTNGSAIYDNTSSPKESSAGDDIAIVPQGDNHYADLSVRMLGGGQVEWYRDGGITEMNGDGTKNVLGLPDFSQYARYEAGISEQVTEIKGNQEGLAVKCITSEGAKKLAESQAQIWIIGNSSERGGGLGSNGGIIIGIPDKEYGLTVVKNWEDTPQDERIEITVNLKIGNYVLDSIKLNADNGWTGTFEGLPDPASLTDGTEISIEEVTIEGFEVSYSNPEIDNDNRTIKIALTNTKEKKTGNLTVSKTVEGSRGDRTKEFTFIVILDDHTISGVYGDMVFKNGEAVFTLKDGESSTATGLPDGVSYKVIEEEANKNGYVTEAEGEVGTIEEGITAEVSFLNTKNGKPGKPIEPEEPDKPEEPDEPDKPDKPEEPEEPDKPDKPEEPDEPEEPDKPDKPEEPDEPEEPDKPEEPDEPVDTDETGEPDKIKDNPKSEYVPQTGDSTHVGLWLMLSIISGTALIILNMKRFIRRRR